MDREITAEISTSLQRAREYGLVLVVVTAALIARVSSLEQSDFNGFRLHQSKSNIAAIKK